MFLVRRLYTMHGFTSNLHPGIGHAELGPVAFYVDALHGSAG